SWPYIGHSAAAEPASASRPITASARQRRMVLIRCFDSMAAPSFLITLIRWWSCSFRHDLCGHGRGSGSGCHSESEDRADQARCCDGPPHAAELVKRLGRGVGGAE